MPILAESSFPAWGVAVAILAVVAVWATGVFNGLTRKRNGYKNAFAQIDVQLKRRYDLIPNLVETVKGYAKHERETLEAVVKARNVAAAAAEAAAKAAGDPDAMARLAQSEAAFGGALSRLLVTVERYPELKANQNFLELQEELTATENKVAFARQAYNDAVTEFNNARSVFPTVLLAGVNSFSNTGDEMHKGASAIFVPAGATLRMDSATDSPAGFLEARGGYGCAAIGGKHMGNNDTGTIIVEGGEINAVGGFRAAAIGGGWQGAGGTIEIAGGIVTATSGDYPGINYSAAIGGGFGNGAYAPAYRQSGGTVVAYGSFDDIGGGALRASSAATITGGSLHLAARDRIRPAPSNATERVWCVTVPDLKPDAAIADVRGLPAGYGLNGLFADAAGKLYLWLPDGEYALTIADVDYVATVSGANTEAVRLHTGPDSLRIESIAVTDDAVILVVSAVPEEWLADNARKLRVRASATLPLPEGDDALLPGTDVTATPNPDGTVTLTLPRTADTSRFFRVEGE